MPHIDPNDHDKFVLRQRVKLVINQYVFSIPEEGREDDGEEFCFVEQKRFKFKEDIRFFTGEDKKTELMKILARQRFDPKARYDVTTPDGAKVGEIQKVFGASLLRSTFDVFDAQGREVCRVHEKSLPIALFRRLVGFVPYIGNYSNWLPIAYDFVFMHGEKQIGINRRRRWKFRDIYDIDLTEDTEKILDRRLVLAITVGQDALQAR